MLATRESLQSKDTHILKVKRWKKIFHANENEKKAGLAIHISDKIDFKEKSVTKDIEGHLYNDKGVNPRRGYNICKHMCT